MSGFTDRAPDGQYLREPAAARLVEALEAIKAVQPRTLGWIRKHGIVFDGPLGTDPGNWQQVAFSIYADLCEADTIARHALEAEAVCDRCDGDGVITLGGMSVNPSSGMLVPDPQEAHDETCPDCDGNGR